MRTSVLFVALAALASVAVACGDNEAGIALGGEVEAITDGTGAFSALSKLADGEKPTAAAPKMAMYFPKLLPMRQPIMHRNSGYWPFSCGFVVSTLCMAHAP